MSDQDKYKPINCDYYDHFEIHAMRKTWLKIEVKEESTQTYYTKIKTLKTQSKSEYATLLNEHVIRLDQVLEMVPVDMDGSVIGQLLDKIDYNHWANELIIKVLADQEIKEDMSKTCSHIFNAMDIWNTRMRSKGYNYNIWQVHSKDNWTEIAQATYLSTVAVLSQHDTDTLIHYTNLAGENHQSSIKDIILHVVNHGTYHRGQVIQLLQQQGLKTVSTDFINYSRLR